ncbi:DoxX family protein [Fulvivirga sp.]|uniref:DoxX family protein n=1 Tax=Fulvivirga sp. TaxID=1931237 RepID=UPI0032ED383F
MNTKIINILLWVAQGIVAALFFFAFYAKLLQPAEETAKMMPWVAEQPTLATIAGIADLLGALGLILPAALRIQPKLTTLAAYGGVLLMLAGTAFHLMRGETEVIGLNIILIAFLAFIIWGRTKKTPIAAN